MKRIGPLVISALLAITLAGCPPAEQENQPASSNVQYIRVLLIENASQMYVSATANPILSVSTDPQQHELAFPPDQPVLVTLNSSGWRLGSLQFGPGILTLWPGTNGTLSVNQSPYRGALRLIPRGDGFDCINVVEVDDYLKGVLARELYPKWQLEAFKAQAVVARTYALYTAHTDGLSRDWDVYSDTRSQVYGGIAGETANSREAVADTAGLVLTYGSGDGKIFPAYFSSDSGGITQSAYDAFGIAPIPPLEEQDMRSYGDESPYRNWGPITISKLELTRRIRLWASRRSPPRAEMNMATVADVELVAVNRFGRPRTFKVTDANGQMYLLAAEELRTAFDTDPLPNNTLPSSFCKVDSNADSIIFYDGHGLGHGVGMSQWFAEDQAERGMDYEQILTAAYPQVKFARAY